MFCAECGKEVKETWKRCPYCGNILLENEEDYSDVNLTEESIQDETKDSYKTVRIALKIISIIAFTCFFCPLYMFSCGGQEIFSVSGLDLMIGFEYMDEQMEGHIIYGLLGLFPLSGVYYAFQNKKQLVQMHEVSEIKEAMYDIFEAGAGTIIVNCFFKTTMLKVFEDTAIYVETCTAWDIMIWCGLGMMILSGYYAYQLETEKADFVVECLGNIFTKAIEAFIAVAIIYFLTNGSVPEEVEQEYFSEEMKTIEEQENVFEEENMDLIASIEDEINKAKGELFVGVIGGFNGYL